MLGGAAKVSEPKMMQAFLIPSDGKDFTEKELTLKMYLIRARAKHHIFKLLTTDRKPMDGEFHFASMSSQTVVYKVGTITIC